MRPCSWLLSVIILPAMGLAQNTDPMVKKAQEWVNSVYKDVPGYVLAPTDGKTGWPTMYSLTRALQHEVGIPSGSMSNTFGPTTLSLVTSILGEVGPNSPQNVIKIVQSALYCKGYPGDSISGTYAGETSSSVLSMRHNMGFTDSKSTVSPKEFKALLTMDAYVLISGGSSRVRTVQQWMNQQYYAQSWFFIIPTEGYYSRDVATALIYAIQTYLGVAGANGNYGPATRAAVKASTPLDVGSSGTLVRLFQAALIFNLYDVDFDGVYSTGTASQTAAFQQFVALPITRRGDYQTWSSLLASTGDPDRPAGAVDCITTITAERATTLFKAGYRYVGRYITNMGGSLDKKIKPGELSSIFSAGLRVFPLWESGGWQLSYFTRAQGVDDAGFSADAAAGYGFLRGTIIYFAVDFDALDTDVTSSVIPYFQGLNDGMDQLGNPYRIGIYGPRNVCSRVSNAGFAVTSFAGDLSTGWSGNLGFPLPRNWAFDQIATLTVGSGSGSLEIDKDVVSGRDTGQGVVKSDAARLDVAFDNQYKSELYSEINAYKDQVKSNTLLLIHSMNEALDVVFAYDDYITKLSRSWGIRKALIQSEIFWEYWKQTVTDPPADVLVQAYYNWKIAFEAWQSFPIGDPPVQPIGSSDDSSTGFGQIFASTAIKARNWAIDRGHISGSHINGDDWHVKMSIWNSLHDDGKYNIGTAAIVLIWGAFDMGISRIALDYTASELHDIFQRYNGFGDDAVQYGYELRGVYDIFEHWNALSRGDTSS